MSIRRGILALWVALLHKSAEAQLPTTIEQGTITVSTQFIGAIPGGLALDLAQPVGDVNRLFVASQSGRIGIIRNNAMLPTPYLDISSGFGLIRGDESGLLGMAFHPNFMAPGSPGFGKFYTYTSEEKVGTADFYRPEQGPTGGALHNVVREWSVDPTSETISNPATASRVLFRAAPRNSLHNGGCVKFGPDGKLYITIGDGLSVFDAQDFTRAFGKVLRIDPIGSNSVNGQYGIPNDNPFAAPGDPGLDEVYASGLRNPFRMSFDRLTGTPYVADVGGATFEEVDVLLPGRNYGWPYFGGTQELFPAPSGFEHDLPIAQYARINTTAIIGGFVYRGSAIPELYGKYVFGDAYDQRVFYVDATGGQMYAANLQNSSLPYLSAGPYGFGEDFAGELYITVGSGEVLKVVAVPEAGTCFCLAFVLAWCRRTCSSNQD